MAATSRFFNDPDGYVLPADMEEGLRSVIGVRPFTPIFLTRFILLARLNSQHRYILQLIDEQFILAPVQLKPGDQVLDCATGTGKWTVDLLTKSRPNLTTDFTGIWLLEVAAKLAEQ